VTTSTTNSRHDLVKTMSYCRVWATNLHGQWSSRGHVSYRLTQSLWALPYFSDRLPDGSRARAPVRKHHGGPFRGPFLAEIRTK